MLNKNVKFHPKLSNLFADRLFMTREALIGVLTEMHFSDSQAYYEREIPTYQDESKDLAVELSSDEISVTTNFTETDIPDNSIALHRIVGTIFADYDRWRWYFSTKQFIDDIRAADKNPQVIAHFLFINSGGGEAWYLEKAYEAVGELRKPVIAFVEKRCCSAAYYIGCNTGRIFSTSINDTVGSIGTMVAFLDIIPYFEAMGAKWIEEYSNLSHKKNARFNKLLDGKPKEYKEKELDPLAKQFIAAVRQARDPLSKLPEKHDVFAGDSYSSEEGRSIGLIDEITELELALSYTLEQGRKWKAKVEKQNRMHTYID
ncbi:MAG: S49 family peptidase [Bacteroidales bacterium]|nr:S49 family peptidase [Bacteroidales bacterium]